VGGWSVPHGRSLRRDILTHVNDGDARESAPTKKARRGPIIAAELMVQLEGDPDFLRRRAHGEAAHAARVRESAPDFQLVRGTLEAAGIASADFGRFTSGRHPDVIRQSVFDYKAAVPVLLEVLPRVKHPNAKEAVVRSLTTSYARPAAAEALIAEFRNTSVKEHEGLKWALGNALGTVTTPQHLDVLLDLVRDRTHGIGRQMIVDRVGRISGDDRVVQTLMQLTTDEDVAFQAMAGLRRRLGQSNAAEIIRPLTKHGSARIRDAARRQLKLAEKRQ
jgi:hypothetical protein